MRVPEANPLPHRSPDERADDDVYLVHVDKDVVVAMAELPDECIETV